MITAPPSATRHGPDAMTERLVAIAHEAGHIGMNFFRLGQQTSATIWNKDGGSPVTEADLAVDAFLHRECRLLEPAAAWLSEETADDPARLGRDLVWIVDPIDGTRAFLSGSPDWAVCIGLLAGGKPLLGVVHAPALSVTYVARLGDGTVRNGQSIRVSPQPALAGARVAGPRSMLDVIARDTGIAPQPKVPSLALRITRVAEGALDAGIASPNAHDWDLAAADLVLSEAGGRLTRIGGESLTYNRERPTHPTLIASNGHLHADLQQTLVALRQLYGKTASSAL